MRDLPTLFLDIGRWLLATLLMGFIIFCSVTYALQGFEYYLTFTAKLTTFAYLIAWALALGVVLPIFTFTTAFIVYFVMLLVRQKLAFGNVFGGIYFLSIIAILICFWLGWIEFGWEYNLKTHPTLDKWVFSLFWLGMFGIPKKISDNYQQYMR